MALAAPKLEADRFTPEQTAPAMDDANNSNLAPAYPPLETMLAVSMARTVRVLLPSASIVLVIFAAFYALALPPEAAVILVPFSLATAALSAILWIFAESWDETDPRIHTVALLIACLVAAKSLTHIWLTASPTGLATLIFILILGGSAFVKRRHLYFLSGFVAIGLGVCSTHINVSPNWLYLWGVAASASVVGMAVQGARLKTYRALGDAHNQILGQAQRDQLTGLGNRGSLMQRLDECLARRDQRAGDHFVVTYLDLDGLKAVNDIYGHTCGDAVIAAVGERLRAGLDGHHFAARIGGDEFVVVSEGVPGEPLAVSTAHRIYNAICGIVACDSHEIPLRASFGWAWSGNDFDDAEEILAAADRAMYAMKRARQRSMIAADHAGEGIVALSRAASAGGGVPEPLRDESGSHPRPTF